MTSDLQQIYTKNESREDKQIYTQNEYREYNVWFFFKAESHHAVLLGNLHLTDAAKCKKECWNHLGDRQKMNQGWHSIIMVLVIARVEE